MKTRQRNSLADSIEDRIQLLTVADLAEVLNLSLRTIYDMVESGSLPVMRIKRSIRLDPKTTADWLRKQQL